MGWRGGNRMSAGTKGLNRALKTAQESQFVKFNCVESVLAKNDLIPDKFGRLERLEIQI